MQPEQKPGDATHRGGIRRRPIPGRGTAVLEAVATWLLGVGAVLGVLAALLVGAAVHGRLSERASAESAQRTPVVLHLLDDVRPLLDPAGRSVLSVPARVTWLGPDHRNHHTVTAIEGPHQAGDTLVAWADRAGNLAPAPIGVTTVLFVSVSSVVLMLGGVWGALAGMWWTVTRLTMAGNHGSWAREDRAEPGEIDAWWRAATYPAAGQTRAAGEDAPDVRNWQWPG